MMKKRFAEVGWHKLGDCNEDVKRRNCKYRGAYENM